MRRLALIVLLSMATAVGASVSAEADTTAGGAPAAYAAASSSGGVSYATLPPEPKGEPVKKKVSKKQKKRARKKARRKKPVPKAPPPPKPAPAPVTSDHVFPIRGTFSFGGKDSRFGAGRPGHIHQGQDMSAAEGTPIVAPWAGTVEVVRFQAGGAGYYVVLDGDGEDRDYVFMHLRKGSIVVEQGQAVAKGAPLAEVGNTGSSSGAHLHFEIWVGGGWYTGGKPVDPLPFLKAWL